MDQCIAHNKRFVENIKANIQEASIKDLRVKESKAWKQEAKLDASQPMTEISHQVRRNQK